MVVRQDSATAWCLSVFVCPSHICLWKMSFFLQEGEGQNEMQTPRGTPGWHLRDVLPIDRATAIF